MRVVGGAVERVDDPAPARAAAGRAALLGQDRVVGERLGETADDELLGALVHLGHQIGRGALERDAMGGAELGVEELSRCPRRIDRDLTFPGRHQSLRSFGTRSAAAVPMAISAMPCTPSAAPTPKSDASAPIWN